MTNKTRLSVLTRSSHLKMINKQFHANDRAFKQLGRPRGDINFLVQLPALCQHPFHLPHRQTPW
jgi:hypothetical protein